MPADICMKRRLDSATHNILVGKSNRGHAVAISVKDLIDSEMLKVGDRLIWKSRMQNSVHEAIVLSNGTLRTIDGTVHKSPTGALKHLNGNKPVDGWNAWKLAKDGSSLSKLRSRLSQV
ncbi:MAG: hypothetical protein RL008_382 [Actinomycetota bacterium]